PETYGAQQGISPQEAQEYISQQYQAVQHTLNLYCLDYWRERLGLDICAMTTAQGPSAVLSDDTVQFQTPLKASGKRRILLT
ncbi:GMP/IMP nucleotidase, partial [Salmonella enterica subsp. enterica serovar Infantis]